MASSKNYKGLNDEEVQKSRRKFGDNVIIPPKKTPAWKLFFEKFNDPIIEILLIAALLSLGIGFINHEFIETIGIFAAIFLSVGIGFWFEYDANKKFDILNAVNDESLIKVIRNGIVTEVYKKEIVVGDIVILNTGDEIPADGELLESISLQIDESCLTGEPFVDKTTDPEQFDKEATYPSNCLMRGTKIMDGNAIMQVAFVGNNTEYGRVAKESTKETKEETPLNKQLAKLAKFIGVIGFIFAILTFVGLFTKDIISGHLAFSTDQWFLICSVILSVVVMLTKTWMPTYCDAVELIRKKEKPLPNIVEEHAWWRWIIYGIGVLVICWLIALMFGINILNSQALPDIKSLSEILQYFMVAVTLIVVAVPEGLPMSVTLSLALSMRRMLKSNNLVRKMHAAETMGATTVICTDKTGTLTKNQMQVSEIQIFGLKDNLLRDDEISNLTKENIAINSTAYLNDSNDGNIKALGNPTEAALLMWLNSQNSNYQDIRNNAQIDEQLSFSTERKYMATVVKSNGIGKKVLYVKGAPEIVYSKCKHVLTDTGIVSANEYWNTVSNLLSKYQSQAMRTLGFAYEIIEDDKPRIANGEILSDNLTYIGIVAISDPLRIEVPPAVRECMQAGVRVIIVTGDTPGTAGEIARQIGILESENKNQVITGPEFGSLSDAEIMEILKDLKVLCRARPSDKQRLVQLLQKNGDVVAVTGDGTNDAPALNYAHVGLSMGTGTAVAKDASDITIIDDSFSSIGKAILWGRSLYQNIQRFIMFQLTINLVALLVVLIGSLMGHDLPLTVTQMLWVNLIMDTFAAGALASLPPNKNVMKNKPRRNNDFIVNKDMRINIFAVGGTFLVVLFSLMILMFGEATPNSILTKLFSYPTNVSADSYSLSLFFTIFVMMQFWNMFNAKAFESGKPAFANMKNSIGFIAVLLIILVGQILIVQFGGEVFRTVPICLRDWLIIMGGTSLIFFVEEGYRLIKHCVKK